MTTRKRNETAAVAMAEFAMLLVVFGPVGCTSVPTRQFYHADRYRLDVNMDTSSHRLVGRATLDLVMTGDSQVPGGQPVTLELLLHPALKITRVAASGARVRRRLSVPVAPAEEDDFAPRRHLIVLDRPVDALTLFVEYSGELFQDAATGEVPGEIHNFTMRAHIGEDGIYLDNGYWYPQPAMGDNPEPRLTDYTLVADPVPGFELQAGAAEDAALSEQTGRLAWRSPYPADSLVLVGGAHEVHRATHDGVAISLHLKPNQAGHAEGLMETVRRNLDRYVPLIGPYPATDFAIVDNFFSSGFAFPTFTLLSSAVIDMGRRSQTAHGYIDHEMLHCWWGNGVHVDSRDGNWCEALASYGANYYGFILDGAEDEARRIRRNYCHLLSRLKPEKDKPLGTFGLDDGCSRGIAYKKGAMVFHLLARKIGQDNFWAAMRRFTAEYVGRYASWDDIRRLCEQAGGVSLETFFRQWIRSGGAPTLEIEEARYDSADQTLTIVLAQGEPAFELEVPIRVTHADGTLDIEIPLRQARQEVTVPISVVPMTVEADPDYHLFRKLPLGEILPTTASTRFGTAFASVTPGGEPAGEYEKLRSIFESSFKEDQRIALTAGNIQHGALAERCVLVLGEAVRDPYVAAFLSAIEFPVRWTADGFDFDGTQYTEPGHAILCTARHPGVPGGGITVVFANSDEAIPKATHVPMYSHSTVIFKDGRPVLRHDEEPRPIVAVDRS